MRDNKKRIELVSEWKLGVNDVIQMVYGFSMYH